MDDSIIAWRLLLLERFRSPLLKQAILVSSNGLIGESEAIITGKYTDKILARVPLTINHNTIH